MLKFKPLTLDDRYIFKKYIVPYNFETCEYSFANLVMWKNACEVQYTILNGVLIIKKIDFDGSSHFMQPLNYKKENLKEIVEILYKYKEENQMDYLFKDAETTFIHDFIEVFKDKYEVEEDRDNFDYIYESEKLINLSGKLLHKKKNHLNYFINNIEHLDVDLTQDLTKSCILAAKEWCYKNFCRGYLLSELKSIEELLINKECLNLIGMAVYINDKISAFTLGEIVNKNMAIIHVEKADSEIRGLYNYINKTFVERYLKHIPYINREQDLGIEGLRAAKLSYSPFGFAKKYKIK
ncbi:MAG: DUF2156 domain-containing protein [Solirubrobacterales bacterium]